jgi:hypothetical protein
MGSKSRSVSRSAALPGGASIRASSRLTDNSHAGSSSPQGQQQPVGRTQYPHAQQPQRSYGQIPQLSYGPPERRGPRKSWTARHKVLTIIGGTFEVFIVMGVIGAIAGTGKQPSPAPAAAATTAVPSTVATHSPKATRAAVTHPAVRAKTLSKPKARTGCAEAACDARGFASGDIYVRWEDPGVSWTAQELGGEWGWNSMTPTGQTSVQEMFSASPPGAGNCTQAGYVADNPGYDAKATPARPLENVVAETGPAC